MGILSRLFGGGGVSLVKKYSEERQTPSGSSTYHYSVYKCGSAQKAREFLDAKTISAKYTYIIVETPEGNWGKDIGGMYKENE